MSKVRAPEINVSTPGEYPLDTNRNNFQVSVDCVSPVFPEEMQRLDLRDNLVVETTDPTTGKVSLCSIAPTEEYMISRPTEVELKEFIAKNPDKAELPKRELEEYFIKENLKIKNLPNAVIKFVDLEPETRKIKKVTVDIADPKLKEEVEKILKKVDFVAGKDFAIVGAKEQLASLTEKLRKLSLDKKVIVKLESIAEVDGGIAIGIKAYPIPTSVVLKDLQGNPQPRNNYLNVLLDILDKEVFSSGENALAFFYNEPKIALKVAQAINSNKYIAEEDVPYTIMQKDVEGDTMVLYVRPTPPATVDIKPSGFDDLELEVLKKIFDRPLTAKQIERRINDVRKYYEDRGFTVFMRASSASADVVSLEVVKIKKTAKISGITGIIPSAEYNTIVDAFGLPKDKKGWTSQELSTAISGVESYLKNKGYILTSDITIIPDGNDLRLNINLQKIENPRLFVLGKISKSDKIKPVLTDEELAAGVKRIQETVEKLSKTEMGDRAEFVNNDTMLAIAQGLNGVIHTGEIRPMVNKDSDGKNTLTLVTAKIPPDMDYTDISAGYANLGFMIHAGFSYDNKEGTRFKIGGSWAASPTKNGKYESGISNWDRNQFNFYIFVERDIGENDTIGVSAAVMASKIEGDKSIVGNAGLSYKHYFGDNFAIKVGQTIEFVKMDKPLEGYTGKPVGGSTYLEGQYFNSKGTLLSAGVGSSYVTKYYQQFSIFFEQMIPVGIILANKEQREAYRKAYVDEIKKGEHTLSTILTIRGSAGYQLGSVPELERYTLMDAKAPLPMSLAGKTYLSGTYYAGASMTLEQRINKWLGILFTGQFYMLGGKPTHAYGAGISIFSFDLWVGWGSEGLIVYFSPAQFFRMKKPFYDIDKQEEKNKQIKENNYDKSIM